MAILSNPISSAPTRIVRLYFAPAVEPPASCVKKCKVGDESARIGLKSGFDGAGQRARTMGGARC